MSRGTEGREEMGIRETYFIRIYRRNRKDPRILVGTVESNGDPGKKGFHSFDELREILIAPGRPSRGKKGMSQPDRSGGESN